MKTITITKQQLQQLKNNEVISSDFGYLAKFNGKPYLMRCIGLVNYTNVYIPNPQGQGKTTLSLKELIGLQEADKLGKTYFIYRGDVKNSHGETIEKDLNNKEYTDNATKIELRLIKDEFGMPKDIQIVSQSSTGKFEPKEEIKLSLLQEVDL